MPPAAALDHRPFDVARAVLTPTTCAALGARLYRCNGEWITSSQLDGSDVTLIGAGRTLIGARDAVWALTGGSRLLRIDRGGQLARVSTTIGAPSAAAAGGPQRDTLAIWHDRDFELITHRGEQTLRRGFAGSARLVAPLSPLSALVDDGEAIRVVEVSRERTIALPWSLGDLHQVKSVYAWADVAGLEVCGDSGRRLVLVDLLAGRVCGHYPICDRGLPRARATALTLP